MFMNREEYYKELKVMVDKAKELKDKISKHTDEEARGYLRLALERLYSDMRQLIKENDNKHNN